MTGADVPAAARAIAKPECEHYWAFHCYDGLSVRLCRLCHEPDWEDVHRERAEAVAAERERCAQLAERHRAHYGCYVAIEASNAPVVTSGLRPFADLLREQS